MSASKLSIALSCGLTQFIEATPQRLQAQELEKAYAQASSEVDPLWDITIADGLFDD